MSADPSYTHWAPTPPKPPTPDPIEVCPEPLKDHRFTFPPKTVLPGQLPAGRIVLSERSKKLGPEQRDAADAADAATAAAGGAAGRETILLFGSIVSGLIDRLLRWISPSPMDFRSMDRARAYVLYCYLPDTVPSQLIMFFILPFRVCDIGWGVLDTPRVPDRHSLPECLTLPECSTLSIPHPGMLLFQLIIF